MYYITRQIHLVAGLITESGAKAPNLFLERPSIITIARLAGYKTYWISNQGKFGTADTPSALISNESETVKFLNSNITNFSPDSKLIDELDAILNPAQKNNIRNKLIILHMAGSHPAFLNRYPETFAKFTPEDYYGDMTSKEKLSQYDNSIYYTDFVVDKVINLAKKIPGMAFVLYTSDHGLSLTEGQGFLKHGSDKSSYTVPFFIWGKSGTFTESTTQAMKTNKNKPFGTENMFYSLLNLLRIQIPEYESKKDILNPEFTEEPIFVTLPDQTLVNFDIIANKETKLSNAGPSVGAAAAAPLPPANRPPAPPPG